MHEIEPFYRWRDLYIASEDKLSPFFKREYNEFEYSQTIYNYFIHPQWDEIGSPTLFCKILFADYNQKYAVIEFFGEWNDCIHNDIMYLKRNVVDKLMKYGINRFILIGENVLNFHASDECYYEEWYEDVSDEGGWLVAINFREHVLNEMRSVRLHHYLLTGAHYDDINWRAFEPAQLCQMIDSLVMRALPEL